MRKLNQTIIHIKLSWFFMGSFFFKIILQLKSFVRDPEWECRLGPRTTVDSWSVQPPSAAIYGRVDYFFDIELNNCHVSYGIFYDT